MTALASSEDVAASLMRGLTPAENEYVETLLNRAHQRIAARAPDAVKRAETDETVRGLITEIEAEAVARVFRAEGAIYSSESEGEYSYRLNESVASAALWISDDEWTRLGSSLSSVRVATDDYLSTRFGGIAPDRQFQRAWPAVAYMSERL